MARKETLVQLTDELVDKLDELATKRGVRRSELIREVLAIYVNQEDDAEKDRRTIEGYKRFPPGGRDEWGDIDEWNEAALRAADEDGLIE